MIRKAGGVGYALKTAKDKSVVADLEIPVNGRLASQIMTVPLDGTRYRLKVYYSFRQGIWMLDLQTDRGTDLLLGIKIVPEWGLISRFQVAGLPTGDIIALDTTETDTPPGRDEFGLQRRVRLYYREAA